LSTSNNINKNNGDSQQQEQQQNHKINNKNSTKTILLSIKLRAVKLSANNHKKQFNNNDDLWQKAQG